MATEGRMKNFMFYCPTKEVFGAGEIKQLPELVPADARVMMTYGGGSIKRNGIYDKVKTLLGDRIVVEVGGIEANPDFDTVMKGVEVLKESKANFVLAVGGGSVLDGSKFMVCAATWTETDAYTLLRTPDLQSKAHALCPIGTIMTLPATGSEMNFGGVISCRRLNTKTGFTNRSTQPAFCILDPEFTYSLPHKQVANGLADTFVHIMEQYTCHYMMNPVVDETCEGMLRNLVRYSDKILECEHPDYQARAIYFNLATEALNHTLGKGVVECWGTHFIGHELTVFYGYDHGLTLAIILPRFLKKLIPQRKQKLAQMAERVWMVPREGKSDEELSMICIDKCEKWFQSLGLKTHISENGGDDSHFVEIASRFKTWFLGPEKLIGEPEVLEILKGSL